MYLILSPIGGEANVGADTSTSFTGRVSFYCRGPYGMYGTWYEGDTGNPYKIPTL